ncbi:MAG TPA: ATP-grasp domain-containing protein [Actinomycetes bacterium]|nr:ATP-grasp domain-containing protein [Actinomycetes bacterium]
MTIVALEALQFGLSRLAAASRERGQQLCLLTRDRATYWYELSRDACRDVRVIDVETFDADRVLDCLAGIPDLAGLINPTDTWSLQSVAVAQRLGVPSQNAGSVRLVRNKARLRDFLHDRGLSRSRAEVIDPQHATSAELVAKLEFPVVIKDAAGTSSRNVWLVRSPQELNAALTAAREATLLGDRLTAESYFCGPLFSIEAISWRNQTRVLGVNSRILSSEPHFREEALSFPIALPSAARARLHAWLVGVLDAICYTDGFSHTELIMTRDGPEVVEINPRLGGALVGESISQAFGINVYEAFVDMALGRRPALMDAELRPRKGLAQILVYPRRAGILQAVDGTQRLAEHPGDPCLYPVLAPGTEVRHLTDQRGCVAFLLASGETAEIALQNAISACGGLSVRIGDGSASPAPAEEPSGLRLPSGSAEGSWHDW